MVTVRPIGPADRDAVLRLHTGLPERDRYTRFFGISTRGIDQYADSISSGRDGHEAVGAFHGDRLLGVASYATLRDPGIAEFALAVGHDVQVHGVGTLLLEELVSVARAHGIGMVRAMVLAENNAMLRLLARLGLPVTRHLQDGVVDVELRVDYGPDYLAALTRRERRADQASLHAVLRPRSVVVIGAGRRAESVGHAVLCNLVDGGYQGARYAVNPLATDIDGVRCYPSVGALPVAPELAVVCLPAGAVAEAARQCGERGVKAVVVIAAGLSGADAQGLRDAARRYGMRLVGPNCLGVWNSDPAVRLNATFARGPLGVGEIGVVTQSGGVAIALLGELSRLGFGVSSLVSTGDKYDVSGNDLLLWWNGEATTRAAVLYLESFGNPRKFARLGRELAAAKPVLVVRPPATAPGQRAAASHTAALATPAVTADALFRQAGLTVVDRLSELPETLSLLLDQPLPAGRRVGVISNAGGAGVLAADAAVRLGLSLPGLSGTTTAALGRELPASASLANPVDTTAVICGAAFGSSVAALLRDCVVDAVIAVAAPTALGDPIGAITASASAARRMRKPLLAVHLTQPEPVTRLLADAPANGGPPDRVPCYADPVAAVTALRRAVDRQEWLSRPRQETPCPPGFDPTEARVAAATFLATHPDGGWLDPEQSLRFLATAGIPTVAGTVASTVDEAVSVAVRTGCPVALKAVAPGLVHKSSGGGVALGVSGADRVRAACAGFFARFGADLRGVFVQPMAPADGAELLVGVKGNPVFGPLLVFGAGGVHTDTVADRTARLTPITVADLSDMLHGLRCSTTVFGVGGADEAQGR